MMKRQTPRLTRRAPALVAATALALALLGPAPAEAGTTTHPRPPGITNGVINGTPPTPGGVTTSKPPPPPN